MLGILRGRASRFIWPTLISAKSGRRCRRCAARSDRRRGLGLAASPLSSRQISARPGDRRRLAIHQHHARRPGRRRWPARAWATPQLGAAGAGIQDIQHGRRFVHAHQGFPLRIDIAVHQGQVGGLGGRVVDRPPSGTGPRRSAWCVRPGAGRWTRARCGTGSDRRWCRSSGRGPGRSATRSGRRAMVPSGLRISQMTAAGVRPAMAVRSQPASVWPARTSTPPGTARTGKIWPGCTRSAGLASRATATWMVRARSAAEMPVSTPYGGFDGHREIGAVAACRCGRPSAAGQAGGGVLRSASGRPGRAHG